MRYLIHIVALLSSSAALGQVDIINRSLVDSSLDYLYVGEDNAIELRGVKNATDYQVVVTYAGGEIRHDKDNRYIVRVSTVIDTCFIVAYNKAGKKVFEKQYKTRIPGLIVASLAGHKDTIIKASRILANPFLSVKIPGCYLRAKFRITSFTAIFIHDTDSIYTEQTGYMLSAEQTQAIKTLRSGDKIFFDEIYGLSPYGKRQHLPSFWIKIE